MCVSTYLRVYVTVERPKSACMILYTCVCVPVHIYHLSKCVDYILNVHT